VAWSSSSEVDLRYESIIWPIVVVRSVVGIVSEKR
jgi:hypothetical protein